MAVGYWLTAGRQRVVDGLWSLVVGFSAGEEGDWWCAGSPHPVPSDMGNYRDLRVWQRAHQLAGRMDVESRRFSRGHAELGDQLRRATLSIPTNVAEGASKGRDAEFVRFTNIAIGSAAEVDSLLAHAESVGALDPVLARELVEELTVIRKMLFKLRRALQLSNASGKPIHR